MTETELKSMLKNGLRSGVYFFCGDEDYMKTQYIKKIKDAILSDPSLYDFNYYSFSDSNADIDAIQSAIQSPAMMTEYKLIVCELTSSAPFMDKDKKKLSSDFTEMLEEAMDSPDTVFVLSMYQGASDIGTEKRPGSLTNAVMKKGGNCIFFDYASDNALKKWLMKHAEMYGVSITDSVCQLLINRSGKSMYRLSGEIAKASAYAAANGYSEITADIINLVSVKSDDEDAFALANCISSGDKKGALMKLSEKIARKEEPIVVLGMISSKLRDLAAAAHFAAEGKSVDEFAKAMGMKEYPAKLCYNAVRGKPVYMYDKAIEECVKADTMLKSTQHGFIAIERLICS